MKRQYFTILMSLAVLSVLDPAQARAELIYSLSSTTINPGGTGSIAVTIYGTGPIALSSFEFQIMPMGTTTSTLAFGSPQSDSEFADKSYLFFQNSADQYFDQPGAISSNGGTKLFGGDNTFDGSNVDLGSKASFLLVNLDFTTGSGNPAVGGDNYQISLVNDPNFTVFDDSNGNSLAYRIDPTSTGIVTIASVPEPSAICLTVMGLLIFVGARTLPLHKNVDQPLP